MDILKTGWNFFQNEVLGMAWLNRLIGNLINACGLDATSKIGGSIHFNPADKLVENGGGKLGKGSMAFRQLQKLLRPSSRVLKSG